MFAKFVGAMECRGDSFTIFCYKKEEEINQERISRYIKSEGLAVKIRESFKASNTYWMTRVILYKNNLVPEYSNNYFFMINPLSSE